jgi:hypothetical protein
MFGLYWRHAISSAIWVKADFILRCCSCLEYLMNCTVRANTDWILLSEVAHESNKCR